MTVNRNTTTRIIRLDTLFGVQERKKVIAEKEMGQFACNKN